MSYDIQNFAKEVLERSYQVPVVVDFWAEWCAPCRMLSPVLEQLAARASGEWSLAKVNTEQHPQVAAEYGIQSIPNVKLFVDGEVVNEFVGALPEEAIGRWLKDALPSPLRHQLQQAQELLVQDRFPEAQQLLEEVLEQEPDNDQAAILLATSLLFSEHLKAAGFAEKIMPASDYFSTAEAVQTLSQLLDLREHPENLPDGTVKERYLAAIERLHERDFDAALSQFIELLGIARSYHNDGARKACVAIFNFLGNDHEISQKHRRDFSSALYA
ncbi:thioredoxin [candidate division KSB3 bacterium]|uniref:Thioredoxin n=1 Tax=candidate division KSB3 bacterium TaxID=2044937 RepID=A0A2G6KGJ9_9BACT|nr:MAG: thioredoxin [candidate division KSB3 bacterium]